VGGSIRIPAAFCGTVGHKPTGRMVPNTGFWPPTQGDLSAYLVCGPLCRRVEDVMPILRVLAGPDGADAVVRPWTLDDPRAIDPTEVTVYPVETNGRTRVGPTNRRAVRQAALALQERGAKIGTLSVPRMKRAFAIWSAMMASAEGPSYAEVLGDGQPINAGRELVRLALQRSKHTLPALAVVGLETIAARFPGKLDEAVADGKALQAELEEILGPRGVILHPPYTRPAPRHYAPMLTPFDFVCTGLFNVLEFPSTVVPMGFDDDGLPVAVQVIGRRGNDTLTIGMAEHLERAFGGWQRANPQGHVHGS
jgi:fatty acid amide hydrolase 2